MDLSTLFGGHVELFGPFYALAFLAAYLTAALIGYRRGWPLAAWLLVLAAAGIGGVVGTRLLPLGIDGLRALLTEGALPDAGVRRIPGTVVGALLMAEAARRFLGVRQSMLAPLAYSGLAALAVVRVGCLLAGCCFGTPTDGPWGVTYASGSFVHGFHLAHGIVEAGAAQPHAVHAIPLYDVLFAILGLALLPRLARRLTLEDNLCWVTVGAYSAYRFAQDFVRADEAVALAGLTAIQLVMVVGAIGAFGWVAFSERRARRMAGGVRPVVGTEPGLARMAALLGVLLALRLGLEGWLTAPESAVLFVRLLPATLAVGTVVFRSALAPQIRWAGVGVAVMLPLVMGFQLRPIPVDSTGSFSFLAVDAHVGAGQYEESDICDPDLYRYQRGGLGLAYVTAEPAQESSYELGVRVYGASQQQSTGLEREADDVPVQVVNPYVQYEGAYVGGHLGVHLGQVVFLSADSSDARTALPSVGVRLGPRVAHFQLGVLDDFQFGAPAPALRFGFGTGRLTESGQELRFQGGFAPTGFYAMGSLPVSEALLIEPMGSFGPSEDGPLYHVGARLRYHVRPWRGPEVGRVPEPGGPSADSLGVGER